jgi:hypothetical protein
MRKRPETPDHWKWADHTEEWWSLVAFAGGVVAASAVGLVGGWWIGPVAPERDPRLIVLLLVCFGTCVVVTFIFESLLRSWRERRRP